MKRLLGFSIFFTIVIMMLTVGIAREYFLIYVSIIFLGALGRYTGIEELSFLIVPEPGPFNRGFNEVIHFITHTIGLSLVVFYLNVFIILPWLRSNGILIP